MLRDTASLVLFLYFMTDNLREVYSASVFAPKKWRDYSKLASSAFRRNGVFLRLEKLKTSTSPTLQPDTGIQGYKQLGRNTLIDNNSTTTPNRLQAKGQPIHSIHATQNSQPDLHKVDLVQPESFTKPTSIPPIGKLLEAPSPTAQIKPIESQLVSIKKPESFGPIKEQFVAFEDVSKIEDLPKIPGIDSMENIFKNEDIDKEFKWNLIDKRSFKNKYNGFIYFKSIFTGKHLRKSKKERFSFSPFFRRGHSRSLARIKRCLWTRGTVKKQHEIVMIVPYETQLSLKELKEKVQNVLLGKGEDNGKRVFIPPPPPLQMKSLEPFKKEKDIEDISKESIQIENPKPIEGIDKHLQAIDKQPEIKPISDHLIQNEPFKAVDDIEPIEPISAVQSN